jgi:hypothetical protein
MRLSQVFVLASAISVDNTKRHNSMQGEEADSINRPLLCINMPPALK